MDIIYERPPLPYPAALRALAVRPSRALILHARTLERLSHFWLTVTIDSWPVVSY